MISIKIHSDLDGHKIDGVTGLITRLTRYQGLTELCIYNDREAGDLIGTAVITGHERAYVMGAVWRPDQQQYSYHT